MAYNPSLRTIPREQHAAVIPLQQNASILKWLEGTGRLIPREVIPEVVKEEKEEPDNEEISDLMGNDGFADDDDDDDDLEDND